MSEIVFSFPKLFSYSVDGRLKEWEVFVEKISNKEFHIVRKHGFSGKKIQCYSLPVTSGKNIGKSNETTPMEQAIFEAMSLFNAKKDEGYVEKELLDNWVEKTCYLPMLAKEYKSGKTKLDFPVYLQPKLNGVRCIVIKRRDSIDFLSRKGKSYNNTLQHLVPYLNSIMQDGDILDGEIYHHRWSLNRIASYVKKFYPSYTPQLQYWVYDCMKEDLVWKERYKYLQKIIPQHESSYIVLTDTFLVDSFDEIEKKVDEFISKGFEGGIIRTVNGKYQHNRSKDLIKFKKFRDEEFTIIGGKEGKGRDKGCVIFECITNSPTNPKPFWVRPAGTVEQRKKWFKELDKLIGKKLTVTFLEYSDYGIPQGNTVGVAIRDYE